MLVQLASLEYTARVLWSACMGDAEDHFVNRMARAARSWTACTNRPKFYSAYRGNLINSRSLEVDASGA
jgi:hypothetical protein